MSSLESMTIRPAVYWSILVSLAISIAPWFSGGQDPISYLISGAGLFVASLFISRQTNQARVLNPSLVWAYVLFVGWGGLSLLWTANRFNTLTWFILFIFAGLVFNISHFLTFVRNGKRDLIRLYLVIATIFSLHGFWLYFTSDYGRFTGAFFWANPAAAFLMPAILLTLPGLKNEARFPSASIVGAIFFGTAFTLADSRASLAVMLILGIWLVLYQGLSKRLCAILLFTIVGIFALSYISVQVRHVIKPGVQTTAPGSRFTEAASGESKSGSDRIEYLKSAIDIWSQHLVLGTGAGSYPDVHPEFQIRVISASTSAHNYYIQILSELGVVGGLLLFGLMVILLRGVTKNHLSLSGESLALVFGFVALVAHMGLDIDARYPSLVFLAAALAGSLFVSNGSKYKKPSWVMPALAFIIMVPVVLIYQSSNWARRAAISQDNGDFSLAAKQYGIACTSFFYDPDLLNAEGINLYTEALSSRNPQPLAQKALDLARQAEREDSYDGQHYLLEGRIRALSGDDKGAIAAFKQALRLDPYNHPEYAVDLGGTLFRDKDTSQALLVVTSMLNKYPSSVINNRNNDVNIPSKVADLWTLKGNIELNQDRLDEADKASRRALALDSQSIRARALSHQVELRRQQQSDAPIVLN